MVSLIKFPPTINYAGMPVVFGFSGTPNTNLAYFKVTILEEGSGQEVYTARCFPTPNNPLVGNINLSNQMLALVKNDVEIFTATTINIGKPKNIFAYRLEVVDFSANNGQLTPISTGYTTPAPYYSYQSKPNTLLYTKDNEPPIMKAFRFRRFLTLAPDYKKINEKSIEQLYFIHGGLPAANIKVQKNNNSPVNFSCSTTTTAAKPSSTIVTFTEVPTGVTRVQTINTTYGSIYPYSAVTSGLTLLSYTNNLVNGINSFPSNSGSSAYTASFIDEGVIRITAPLELAPNIVNGSPLFFVQNNVGGQYSRTSLFSGAIASGTTLDLIQKIDVTPKYLSSSLGGFVAGDTMQVWVEVTGGTRISAIRNYIYEDIDCGEEVINVIFSNQLGGVDTLQMIAPKVATTTIKSFIKKAGMDIEQPSGDEFIKEQRGQISTLEEDKEIYNSTTISSLRAYTRRLSDVESEYLTELLNSENVYISLSSFNFLLPVYVKTTEQAIKKQRYNKGEFIDYEIEFEIPPNYYNLINNGCDPIIMNLEPTKYCQIP